MKEELLDENWGKENEVLLRIPVIVRMEQWILLFCAAIIMCSLFAVVVYLLTANHYYMRTFSTFIREILIISIILWWRKISIRHDSSPSNKEFQKPILLTILRGVVWLTTIFSMYRIIVSFIYLFNRISFLGASYFLTTIIGFILNVLVIRYLLLTNKIEKAIR